MELCTNLGDGWNLKATYPGGCQSQPEPHKERYAMKEDTTILPFRQSEKVDDPLTEIAREGASRMLAEALLAEGH